jgi:hypothetical protein
MGAFAVFLVALVSSLVGLFIGLRISGPDCTLSPTLAADTANLLAAGSALAANGAETLTSGAETLKGDVSMAADQLTSWPWAMLAALALAGLAGWWWLRQRTDNSEPIDSPQPGPEDTEPAPQAAPEWGREFKLAFGSAGIKSIIREGRVEQSYQVRSGSETAFEAYADFDQQQERVALSNRADGPNYLTLSETLEARSPLSAGMGNRPPAEVWAMREEWMPTVGHFVDEAAFNLRAAGVWPARITAHLSAQGHGLPALYALWLDAREFPRADRHTHFIVPEGDVERQEALWLLDSLRHARLDLGATSEPMPWHDTRPLALTTLLRDNRLGRDDLDEVAAHVGAALTARVRFETGTSENLSNLMRRLTKNAPHAAIEPCPLTFHFAAAAVPTSVNDSATVPLGTLLPLADATLRALRHGENVFRALDVDIARHLLLVTLPCNDWDDVRRVEQYVLERLEFADAPDRQCVGIFFSGYRPEPSNREERIFAVKLGAVHGGWEAVNRAIALAEPPAEAHHNGLAHPNDLAASEPLSAESAA